MRSPGAACNVGPSSNAFADSRSLRAVALRKEPLLIVNDLLSLPSLSRACLRTGSHALGRDVKHVNVIEAPDLAEWISSGTVLLSSYYALQRLSAQKLSEFVENVSAAGAVAIILKTHRLIEEVPADFVGLCEKNGIALITIDRDVRYENILMDIMLPIVNRKASLLDKHYRMASEMSKIRMEQKDLQGALEVFAGMVGHDLTLVDKKLNRVFTTKDADDVVRVVSSAACSGKNFDGMHYESQRCLRGNGSFCYQAAVHIPLSASEHQTLIVHEAQELDDELLVALDGIVRYLQVDLLNQRNVDSITHLYKNNLVDELLTNPTLSDASRRNMLRSLKLGSSDSFQVVQVALFPGNSVDAARSYTLDSAEMLVAQAFERCWRHFAFRITPNKIAIIVNISEKEPNVSAKLLASIMPKSCPDYIAGISLVGTRHDLLELMDQTHQIKKILEVLKRFNRPLSYGDLGIFKLLTEDISPEGLKALVPEHIYRFMQEEPVLFETLVCYLENGKNNRRTAEALFVHPKTIAYRIGRIVQKGGINFEDADEVLQILFATRILALSASDGKL